MATCYTPKEGYTRNPLMKIPRNDKCPCMSGKKFKHCHAPVLNYYITEDEAKQSQEFLLSMKTMEKTQLEAWLEAGVRAAKEIRDAEEKQNETH